MKTTKKLLSMLLALIMVVSIAVPVFADETNYVITITNSDSISSAGHVYKAYQIFKGTLKESGSVLADIKWGESITNGDDFITALKSDTSPDTAAFIIDGKNIFKDVTSAEKLAEVLSKSEHDTAAIKNAFAKIAKDYVDTDNEVAHSTQSTAPYTILIPKTKAGYYLVLDTLVDETLPNQDISDFILQVVGDKTVEHKGSIPTVDKSVSETGEGEHTNIATGIGDVHYYKIKAELPDDLYLYDSYYLEFQDKMSSGLTYLPMETSDSGIVMKVLIRTGNKTIIVDPDCYDVTPKAETAGANMSVVIPDIKSAEFKSTDGTPIIVSAVDAIEIVYTATVNKDAQVTGDGIPNEAKLVFSNDPNSNGKGTSNTDVTYVYPVNLVIEKYDAKNTANLLDGAQFIIGRDFSDGSTTHKEYAKIDKTTGKLDSWVHHHVGDNCAEGDADHTAAVTAGEIGTILITEGGRISVSGLDAAKFYLKEVAAPSGYNKLTEPVIVTVDVEYNDTTHKISLIKGTTSQGEIAFSADTALVTVKIPNHEGQILPSTGGIGTTLFYVVGGAMVAFAVLSLITKKRMNKE